MKKFSFGIGLIGALVLFAAQAKAEEQKETDLNRLTLDQVDQMVQSKAANVYDNNGEESYKKGHVPTAKLLAIDDIKPADLPGDKDRALVFYCGGTKCMACHQAAHKAVAYGFKKVYIMPDGISGWVKAGKAVEKG